MTEQERKLLTTDEFFDTYSLDRANDYLDDLLNECLSANDTDALESSSRHWFVFQLKKMLANIEPVKFKKLRHKKELEQANA